MNVEQLNAVGEWLKDALPRPLEVGQPIGTFPVDHIYRGDRGDGPRPQYPICTFTPISKVWLGRSWMVPCLLQHKLSITVETNPAGDFDVLIGHFIIDPALGLSGGTVTVSPGVDADETSDNILAALQALEGPTHVATYTKTAPGVVEVCAVESIKGRPLRVFAYDTGTTDPVAGVTIATTQEPYQEESRDLSLTQVSIRIATHNEEGALDELETAWHLACKVAKFAREKGGLEQVRAAGAALETVSGPLGNTRLAGGSQGVEYATVTITFRATGCTSRGVLTIEKLDPLSGTIQADGGDLPVEIEIGP